MGRVVLARKRAMVGGLVAMHLDRFRESGAELVMGTARFTGPKAVAVALNDGGSRALTAERIFLNLGTRRRSRTSRACAKRGRSRTSRRWS